MRGFELLLKFCIYTFVKLNYLIVLDYFSRFNPFFLFLFGFILELRNIALL